MDTIQATKNCELENTFVTNKQIEKKKLNDDYN